MVANSGEKVMRKKLREVNCISRETGHDPTIWQSFRNVNLWKRCSFSAVGKLAREATLRTDSVLGFLLR